MPFDQSSVQYQVINKMLVHLKLEKRNVLVSKMPQYTGRHTKQVKKMVWYLSSNDQSGGEWGWGRILYYNK